MIVAWIFLALLLLGLLAVEGFFTDMAALYRWAKRKWDEREPAGVVEAAFREAELEAKYEAAMAIDIDPPEYGIVPWTPEENELLGVNDTLKLIDHLDRELESKTDRERRESEARVWAALEAGSPAALRVLSKHEELYGQQCWRHPEEVVHIHAHGQVEPIRTVVT